MIDCGFHWHATPGTETALTISPCSSDHPHQAAFRTACLQHIAMCPLEHCWFHFQNQHIMCILGNISRCHHSYPPLFIPLTEMEELSFLQGIFCNWSLHCYNIYILVYNRIIIVTIILILVSSGPVGNPHTTPANGYLHSCLYYTQTKES